MKIQRYHVNPAGGVYRYNDGAYMLFTDHERDKAEAVAAAVAEKTAELAALLVGAMKRVCGKQSTGWWYADTPLAVAIGEKLLALRLLEKTTASLGSPLYRPIQKGPTDETQGSD